MFDDLGHFAENLSGWFQQRKRKVNNKAKIIYFKKIQRRMPRFKSVGSLGLGPAVKSTRKTDCSSIFLSLDIEAVSHTSSISYKVRKVYWSWPVSRFEFIMLEIYSFKEKKVLNLHAHVIEGWLISIKENRLHICCYMLYSFSTTYESRNVLWWRAYSTK